MVPCSTHNGWKLLFAHPSRSSSTRMADRHTSALRIGTGVASLLYRCSRSCLAEVCDGQEAPRSPHLADLSGQAGQQRRKQVG